MWLLDDWLWGTLFNYDNVARDKQIAFTVSAMIGLIAGATVAGAACWAIRRVREPPC